MMEKIEVGAEQEIRNLIKGNELNGKRIFCMGNAYNWIPLIMILENMGYRVEAFVDNDLRRVGIHETDGHEYEVISPTKFFRIDKNKVAILIFSERFWCEMREQMVRLGYAENENLYILEGIDLVKKKKYIKKADALIKCFQERYGNGVQIYVFYGPIGDNYLFSLYLQKRIEEAGQNNILCVGTNATKKIGELFGFRNVEVLEREEIVALEYCYMFLGEEANNLFILPIWDWPFHFNRNRTRLELRFNFMDTFKHYVFGCEESELYTQPIITNNEVFIEKLFEEKSLIKGKTVIFAPFAYSIGKNMPKYFWEGLGKKLGGLGYAVALNIDPCPIHRDKETNFVQEAKEITVELKDVKACVEYAGTIVSMRSGLCDVISSAICKKVIFYPEFSEIDYDRHRSDRMFGGLREMYGDQNSLELDFKTDKGYEEDLQYWDKMVEAVAGFIWEG